MIPRKILGSTKEPCNDTSSIGPHLNSVEQLIDPVTVRAGIIYPCSHPDKEQRGSSYAASDYCRQ
jgi:hypothetical protein